MSESIQATKSGLIQVNTSVHLIYSQTQFHKILMDFSYFYFKINFFGYEEQFSIINRGVMI